MVSVFLGGLLHHSISLAGGPDVRVGWIHLHEKQPAMARRIARDVLTEDDRRLDAHWLYINAQRANAQSTLTQYRAWLDAAPDDHVRRIAAVQALLVTQRRKGDWCAEAEELLDIEPDNLEHRYWVAHGRYAIHDKCAQDTAADIDALVALSDTSPQAASESVRVRVRARQVDAALVEDIAALAERAPLGLYHASRLWRHPMPEGRWARKARAAALEAAHKAGEEDDMVSLYSAYKLISRAGEPVSSRIAEPVHDFLGWTAGTDHPTLLSQIIQAEKSPTSEIAFAQFDAIDGQIPEHGYHRALLEGLRGTRLSTQGRDQEALRHYRLAWEADQTVVNGQEYAWSAATQDTDLENALEVSTKVLAILEQQTYADAPHRQGYSSWESRQKSRLASSLDTRGWLLYKLGRHDEAAVDLQRSLRAQPLAQTHIHLAQVLKDSGAVAVAFEHLVQAAVLSEDGLSAMARTMLNELYPASGAWHPEGLTGYLTARGATLDGISTVHPLLGQPFPITSFQDLRGREQVLDAGSGILVVDFWATWCGPCVQGMPHLQDVAEAYADHGVQLLGLSVDDSLVPVQAFFHEDFKPAYRVGWVGDSAYDQVQFSGVPSLFVLDRQGTVSAYISGFNGAEDDRLEKALDELIGTE